MKIKYKKTQPFGSNLEIVEIGDWIYLSCDRTVLSSGEYIEIPLGIAMELPDGFEAIVSPRSSTFKKFGILFANSVGVIDNSYCGDGDEWHFIAYSTRETLIPRGTRICQFRIQPSQKASVWQKLRWLFTSRVEFVEVRTLGNENRGGIGSTGL